MLDINKKSKDTTAAIFHAILSGTLGGVAIYGVIIVLAYTLGGIGAMFSILLTPFWGWFIVKYSAELISKEIAISNVKKVVKVATVLLIIFGVGSGAVEFIEKGFLVRHVSSIIYFIVFYFASKKYITSSAI